MRLTEAQINAEVEKYRRHLVESNREPTAAELDEAKKADEHRLNRTAGWLGLQSEEARKIFAEGSGAFNPGFNARKLREVA